MRYVKTLLGIAFIFGLYHVAVYSQTAATDCPADKVCITREAAIKALQDADKVTALEAELKSKDTAITGLRDLLNKARIEFAAASGENTALKQTAVQDRAIIDLLLKGQKKKCLPFSICF